MSAHQGRPRMLATPEARSQARNTPSPEPPEEPALPTPSLWTSSLQDCVRVNVCGDKPPSLWHCVMAAPADSHNPRTMPSVCHLAPFMAGLACLPTDGGSVGLTFPRQIPSSSSVAGVRSAGHMALPTSCVLSPLHAHRRPGEPAWRPP